MARSRTSRSTADTVLCQLDRLDPMLEQQGEKNLDGTVSGTSVRAVRRTDLTTGQQKIIVTLRQRITAMRASGKPYDYWVTVYSMSFRRTLKDLALFTEFENKSVRSSRLFIIEDDGPDETRLTVQEKFILFTQKIDIDFHDLSYEVRDSLSPVIQQVVDLLGELPALEARAPLLRRHKNSPNDLLALDLYLDAQDHKQVAVKAFGRRAYTRPLGDRVSRLDPADVLWFSQFKNLVPTEWIVEAMDRHLAELDDDYLYAVPSTDRHASVLSSGSLRRLLRMAPTEVLRRVLNEKLREWSDNLGDAAKRLIALPRTTAEKNECITLVEEVVHGRNQRHIRGSLDLENLVLQALPYDVHLTTRRRNLTGPSRYNENRTRWLMDSYNEQRLAALAQWRERQQIPAETASMGPEAYPEATWEIWRDDPAFQLRAQSLIRHEEMIRQRRWRAERDEHDAVLRSWKKELAARLHDAELPQGHSLAVAENHLTLAKWSNQMHHCIQSYGHLVDTTVLGAVLDGEGSVKLNFEITRDEGITQLRGKYNQPAAKALGVQLAQQVVDALGDLGVKSSTRCAGLEGLDDAAFRMGRLKHG